MACNGCDGGASVTRDQVENLINALIREGTIQGGLSQCGGGKLPTGSAVLQCNELTDKVLALIQNGTIPTLKNIVAENGALFAVDGTGTKTKITDILNADSFDNTIEKNANKEGKFGVKLNDKGGLENTLDGLAIKTGDGLKKDNDGNLTLNVNTGDGLTTNPDGSVKLDLDRIVDNDTIGVRNGKLYTKPQKCTRLTDMNKPVPKLGQHCFYGDAQNTLHLPTNFNASDTQPRNPNVSEVYDYVGWQIASPDEVTVFVTQGNATWQSTNDSGMNEDGTLKNPTNWTDWVRDDNAKVPADIALANRVTALENARNQPCLVNCKYIANNSYTLQPSDEFITMAGGTLVVNADVLPQGKQITVVQSTSNPITITKAGNTLLHAPYKGSLKTAGQNAVVTIMRELDHHVRVFGQTESA